MHVLQFSDPKARQLYGSHMHNIKHAFAEHFNFTYHHRSITLNEGGRCPLVLKPTILLQFLLNMRYGDWLLFLDLDMSYLACDDGAFAARLPRTSGEDDGAECFFVAQDQLLNVNSGFVAVRNIGAGRRFMEQWASEAEALRVCHGPGDQVALQSVILSRAIPGYPPWHHANRGATAAGGGSGGGTRGGGAGGASDAAAGSSGTARRALAAKKAQIITSNLRKGQIRKIINAKTYDPAVRCEAQMSNGTQAQDGTEINYCFSQLMERHGFPPNERSHRGVCLLPRSSRVNMHDFEHFRPGDIFKHSHGKYSPAVGSC